MNDHTPLTRQLERVSFRMSRLEYLIAWALALGTAWTSVIVFPDGFTPWLAALFAAVIGAWSRSFPARRPLAMLGRAVLLLCVALSLHTDPMMGGANGTFFYWTVAIAGAYALLLERRLAITLTALCAAEFLLALWLAPPAGSWRPALSALGVLLIWPSVVMLLAKSAHQADAQVETNLIDAQTDLYNAAGLFAHGSELFRQCRREQRPLSMALLQCADLSEAHRVLGRAATTQALARAVGDILAESPGSAIAARTGMGAFAIVLPDATSQRAKTLILGKLGSPPHFETVVKGQKLVIELDIGVSGAREETPSFQALHDRVLDKMQKRRTQETTGSPTTRRQAGTA